MKMVICLLIVLVACNSDDTHDAANSDAATAAADSPRVIVDSVFPVEAEIRRFKTARGGAGASELTAVASSRAELVQKLMAALAARDTATLSALVLNAAEFIDLYYPVSPYTRPPYRQSPELLWFLLQQNSQKGISRVLARFAGVPPKYEGHTCAAEPVVWSGVRIWEQCVVRWSPTPDAPSPFRLFGGIIERGGRFKFVSYANDL